ncbi:MAG: acyltransferase [Actinobacteria bacterium]|nr:acyltransferase [Actinomycetota bacterium]
MIPSTAAASSALGAYEPSLDGMRGVCIAAVVVYHACAVSDLNGWVRGGFIGVSVFFTLSGFLIASLLLREISSSETIDLMSFWARRIRRLWPASLVVVLAVVTLSTFDTLAIRASDALAATWSFTNWHVIVSGQQRLLQTIVGPLGPTWSLAVEEQFYLVLALLLALAARCERPQRVLLIVAGVGIVVPLALSNLTTDWQPALEFHTVLRMPELFTGVVLAVWHRQGQQPRQLVGRIGGDIAAAVGLVVLLALFAFADYSPPWLLRGGYTLVAAVSALTIAGLLQHGHLAAILSWAPLRSLGTISYSLYLVHWPVMSVLTSGRAGLDGVPFAAIIVTVSVATAIVLHRFVERPIRRMRATPVATLLVGGLAGVLLTVLSLVVL